jgi:hypothetical protein
MSAIKVAIAKTTGPNNHSMKRPKRERRRWVRMASNVLTDLLADRHQQALI